MCNGVGKLEKGGGQKVGVGELGSGGLGSGKLRSGGGVQHRETNSPTLTIFQAAYPYSTSRVASNRPRIKSPLRQVARVKFVCVKLSFTWLLWHFLEIRLAKLTHKSVGTKKIAVCGVVINLLQEPGR